MPPVKLTTEGLNGLAWQAFEQTLGAEISEQKRYEKKALKIWYEKQKPMDDSLTKAQHERFEKFHCQWLLEQRKQVDTATQLDCTNDSVRLLMRHIWLEQQRSQHEKQTEKLHRGRHATVISGPAGRGKSALLDQQLTSMCLQAKQPLPKQINAGHSSWELLQQAINEAKEKGYPLIVSELNLLKSEEIEGLLNNTITGRAAPGFHLYTTVNPASFIGRHRFSPALKNRFTCLSISEYTDQDIKTIANKVLPGNLTTEQREQVVDWHLRLREALRQKKVSLQPAVANLQRLKQILAEEYSIYPPTQEQLQTVFVRQYSLFLTAGECSLTELPELPDKAENAKAQDDMMEPLVRALNSTFSTQPVVVTSEPETQKIEARSVHQVKVPETLIGKIDVNDACKEAKLAMALVDWKNKSESLEAPCAHDTLYSACHQLWQRHFIAENHELEGNDIPLTQEQQATLTHPDNKQLLKRVQELICQAPSSRGLELLWNKLNTPIPSEEEKPSQPQLAESPEKQSEKQSEIKRPKTEIKAIDGRTEDRPLRFMLQQVFENVDCRDYRMNVWQLTVDGRRIKQVTLPTGTRGCDVICPEPLQQPVYTMGEEQYGVVDKQLSTDEFIELPGVYTHQTITQLSTEPSIPLGSLEVIRDRGTGKLLIRLKEQLQDTETLFKLHYVVKRQPPSGNREENLPVSSVSPFDTLIDEELLKEFDQTTSDALMNKLTKWGRDFKAGQNIPVSDGVGILANIIRQKQGACRHRAWAVYAIATAKGLPVRLVTSEMHEWIEYSADRGRIWKKVDLGGTGTGSTKEIQKAEFKKSFRGVMFSGKEPEQFLLEATSDLDKFAKKMGTSIEAVTKWIVSRGKAPLEVESTKKCFSNLLGSGLLSDFLKAIKMVKSGVIDNEEFRELNYKYKLSHAFRTVFMESTSKVERDSILEQFYGMKGFFEATRSESAKKAWFDFLRLASTYLEPDVHSSSEKRVRKLDFWSYGILKHNLLNDLTEGNISYIFRRLESTAKSSVNRIPAEIMAKFKEHYEPYYTSIKAPVSKRVQTVPQQTAATKIEGSSSSFEQQLKTTSIASGYTWMSEGEVALYRLLKHQAPFREQKASNSTRKVKLIQNLRAVVAPDPTELGCQKAILLGDGKFQCSILNTLQKSNDFNVVNQIIRNDKNFRECIINPTQERIDQLQEAIKDQGGIINSELSDLLKQHLSRNDTVEKVIQALPSSFANYLATQSKADKGNLGLYSLAKDKLQRGYQLLTSKEAILAADSQEGEFLPLSTSLIKKHLQEDDSESLFITSKELDIFLYEYCRSLRLDDL